MKNSRGAWKLTNNPGLGLRLEGFGFRAYGFGFMA